MEYQKLLPLFHQDETAWGELYKILVESPLTRRLDIPIRQFHSAKDFPAFFCYEETTARLQDTITRQYIELLRLIYELPGAALDQFMRDCLIEEIQSSNDIEGVRSTRKEIGLAMDEQHSAKDPKNIRLWGIVNKYTKLMDHETISFENSQALRDFYDGFILDEVLSADPGAVPDGKIFRAGSVDVLSSAKTIHRGVFPEEKIIRYMDLALQLLHDTDVPELIRISIYHYLFGYIHPFYDGNGRTSRFITSYYLSKLFHPLVAIRLSITIKRSLRIYYRLFEETNSYGNCGDLTPFVIGFLRILSDTITSVTALLREKKADLAALQQHLASLGLLDDSIDGQLYNVLLQAALFSQEGATLEELGLTLRKSPRTISDHIKKIPSDHILVNKEHRAYRFRLDLSCFGTPTAPVRSSV